VDITLQKKILRYQVTISRIPKAEDETKPPRKSAEPPKSLEPPKFLYKAIHHNLMELLRREFKDMNPGESIGIISDWGKTLYCTKNLESNCFMKQVSIFIGKYSVIE